MRDPKSKLVIIGWDGATWDVIDPLLAQGELPVLARLVDQGQQANLLAPIDPNSFASWMEFATGTNTDKHGIFCSQKRVKDGGYTFSLVSRLDVKAKSFWRLASEQGRRVLVINVPRWEGVGGMADLGGLFQGGRPTPGVGFPRGAG